MKKIISLIIAACMCLSALAMLASCNTTGSNDNSTTEKAENVTKSEERTKAPKGDKETTEKSTDNSDEETNDDATTEEITTEEETTVPERQLTESEWNQLAHKDQYRNVTMIYTEIDSYSKYVTEYRRIDGIVYSFEDHYKFSSEIIEFDYYVAEDKYVADSILYPYIPDYDDVVYDEATGIYSHINPEEITTVKNQKFVYTKYEWTTKNGKLHTYYCEYYSISESTDNRNESSTRAEFSNYGTTVPFKAPNYVEGYDNLYNPTVSASEWQNAFNSLSSDNLQMYLGVYTDLEIDLYLELHIAGNVIKEVECDYSDCETHISYLEKVDGGWYSYDAIEKYFYMDADRSYEKSYHSFADYPTSNMFDSRKNMPALFAQAFKDQYSNFKFDEENNCYYAESLFEGAYRNAKAYFENGKLIKLTYDSVHIYDVTFSYVETVITLPAVSAE